MPDQNVRVIVKRVRTVFSVAAAGSTVRCSAALSFGLATIRRAVPVLSGFA